MIARDDRGVPPAEWTQRPELDALLELTAAELNCVGSAQVMRTTRKVKALVIPRLVTE